MKRFLSLALFVVIPFIAYSQLSWNVRAGMNMSKSSEVASQMGMSIETKMKAGYYIGGGLEYQFNKIWSLQPSLLFTVKGDKGTAAIPPYVLSPEIGESLTMKLDANPMYIQIPLMGAARLPLTDNVNAVLSAGPYFAYGVGGIIDAEATITATNEKILEIKNMDAFGQEGGPDRFDAGVGTGVALEIKKFFISLGGELSLIGVEDSQFYTFSFGAGYRF